MKTIRKLISSRKYNRWPSWDLVFEWEDCIQKEFDLALSDDIAFRIKWPVPFLKRMLNTSCPAFMFQMGPDLHGEYNKRNVVPCLIDFFLKEKDLPLFYRNNAMHPVLLVSSLEVVRYLEKRNCPLNIRHFPLSLSDKYRPAPDVLQKKKYDLVLVGRTNEVLLDYLNRFAQSHPDFYYVYREMKGDVFNYYTSKGEFLGDIRTREQYMALLRESRIGLYATPGMDDGASRTNGFNPVTPRFLEMVSCGCHIIARYPDNEETAFYEFHRFGPSVASYEQFEERMVKALSEEVDLKAYGAYLEKHYTSKRCDLLRLILKETDNE